MRRQFRSVQLLVQPVPQVQVRPVLGRQVRPLLVHLLRVVVPPALPCHSLASGKP
jgi:hypothetical protein